MFPGDGTQTWIVRFSLYEWPESLASCPGYRQPSGPPIILQLGPGNVDVRTSGYSLRKGEHPVPVCAYDENSYRHDNAYQQQTGRTVLDERDAIVLIPYSPLEVGSTYTVEVVANGQSYRWSFEAVNRFQNMLDDR
jgi:hypothetical protein